MDEIDGFVLVLEEEGIRGDRRRKWVEARWVSLFKGGCVIVDKRDEVLRAGANCQLSHSK